MRNNKFFTQNNMISKNYFLTKLTFSASSLLKALSTSLALNGTGPFDNSGIL